MKLVYIAHPLGGGPDRTENLARAARWVAWAAKQGVAPVATWIVLASQWDETPDNLRLGEEPPAIGWEEIFLPKPQHPHAG